MATVDEIADTLHNLSGEFSRRLDSMLDAEEIGQSVAESLQGIGEGLASIEVALRECNGIRSPRSRIEEETMQSVGEIYFIKMQNNIDEIFLAAIDRHSGGTTILAFLSEESASKKAAALLADDPMIQWKPVRVK